MQNRLIWFIAFVVLSLSIAYSFIPDFRDNVVPLLAGLRYQWVLLAFAATLAHFFAEVARWWVYLRSDNRRGTSLFGSLLGIFSLTALVTYVLPAKLGIPLRAYLLTSRAQVRLGTVTVYLVVDGVISYGLWATSALAFYAVFAGPIRIEHFPAYLLIAMAIVVLVVMFRRRMQSVLLRLRANLSSVTMTSVTVAVIVLVADILGYVVRHDAILMALGVNLGFTQVAYATIVSIATGFVSMLPMGIGAYDLSLVFLLSNLGVPLDTAVLVPLLNRAANMLVSIALGLPASYVTGISLLSLQGDYKKGTKTTESP